MNYIICLISSILLCLSIQGQITISTELSKDTIFIGQPSEYSITLAIPADKSELISSVTWELPNDSLGNSLEILSTIETKTEEASSTFVKQVIRFSSENTGYFPIEPIRVLIGESYLISEARLVTVYSTLKDPNVEDIRDYKKSTQVTYGLLNWIKDYWYILLTGILFIIGGVLLWKNFIRKEAPESEEPVQIPEPVIPAFVVALQKINLLKESNLWQRGELKEYHSQISYLLREYLEGELPMSALENTTGEILKSLKKLSVSSEVIEKVRIALSLSDLVKFAKQKPSDTENFQILQDVEKTIQSIHNDHINNSSEA